MRVLSEPLRPVNDDGPKVVHVRKSGPWGDQIPESLEETGRIIVGKKGGGIEAERLGPVCRLPVAISAGRVGGVAGAAIGAVCVGSYGCYGFQAGQRQAERKGVFLVRPPRPLPLIVTVSSPPERITARLPCARRSRASLACSSATTRASPSS